MTTILIKKWTILNGQWVEVPVVLTRTDKGWVEVIPADCPETDKLVARAGY
jgi:hypothetical protein